MSKVPIQAGKFSRRPPGTRRPGTVSVARPSAICRYYNGNVGDTTEVGKYLKGASPYAVLNMAGNVWEWVNDWYDENYYQQPTSENPQGPSSGQYRVLRGGSWNYYDDDVRAATATGTSRRAGTTALVFVAPANLSHVSTVFWVSEAACQRMTNCFA